MKLNIIFGVILLSQSLWAGDKVGNGGGAWSCLKNQNIQHAMLVDLYEAETEFGITLIQTPLTDVYAIANARLDFFKKSTLNYALIWEKYLQEVYLKMRVVDSELVIIDDALFRIKPTASSCNGTWEYVQFANFTHLNQILIRKDYWESAQVVPLHKAALLWHEAIYAWLRAEFFDQDSVRTRQIVGLIFSNQSAADVENKINQILNGPMHPDPQQKWMCMVENSVTFNYYANYGISQPEAQTKTIQKCQGFPFGFHCDEATVRCEEHLTQDYSYTCNVENHVSFKLFSKKGRSKLEAEYEALNACKQGEFPANCSEQAYCF